MFCTNMINANVSEIMTNMDAKYMIYNTIFCKRHFS